MYDLPISDQRLLAIREKVRAGRRLGPEDGMLLYESRDLIGKARIADEVRKRRHGRKAYFVYNQHINYTNVCINHCRFCAFSKQEGSNGAFTLALDHIRDRVTERLGEPIRELHVVGGINPALPFSYYLSLVRTIKELRPLATIKAFTAVEINHFSKISGLSIEKVIRELQAAGLGMMPGGGAEVMNERIHQALFPKKISWEKWIEVVETAHGCGLSSNATMLYGHIETIAERVAHLIRLRDLQDRTGGFSAFIPLAFHSKNTELAHLPATTAFDDLSNIVAARLLLNNFDHIKAYWVMIGEKLAQIALSFGADDLDGTIIEEKITHMAGATSAKGLSSDHMRALIADAGFIPVERDSFYRPVDGLEEAG
ncbi:MAG: aminofutalosine synthase MqnE [Thermodesulfobacteriota bacterium]